MSVLLIPGVQVWALARQSSEDTLRAASTPASLTSLVLAGKGGAMAALHVEIHESPEAIVIRLEGEAGLAAACGLQAPLNAVAARRPRLVVLDLAGLHFAASLFLGTLLAFRCGVVRQGGRVKLAAV